MRAGRGLIARAVAVTTAATCAGACRPPASSGPITSSSEHVQKVITKDPAHAGERVAGWTWLDEQLAAVAVHERAFAHRVLYTWTTPAQIEALRSSRRLLVATVSTGGRPTPFNLALDRVAGGDGPDAALARLVRDHPGLRRRRYAWPSPFATTMGLGPRRYGDALLRVELRGDAFIAWFEPDASPAFRAVDGDGHPVALADVLAAPERLGALLHVRRGPEEPVAYREYVLCNESALQSWSAATPEIAARVAREIELVTQLRDGPFAQLPMVARRESSVPFWGAPGPSPTPLDRWHAALAFDNARYRPTPDNLAAIVSALRGYVASGPPLVDGPSRPWPNASS